jgi:D-3-phosphoglycerate dehydrogenase
MSLSPTATGNEEIKEFSYPKNKINILLLEGIDQQAVDGFKDEGFNVETIAKLEEDELCEKIKNVHVIGVRSKTQLNRKVLSHAKKLMAVGCFCIGTDQTDLEFAAEKGIVVFNAPFANTRSVAEVVMSHIVALARGIGDDNKNMHQGIWVKASKNKYEVRGKTLGIVGYGHVGSQLSILAEAFGMKVIYYDILPKLPLGNANPVDSLEELLQKSHFVTLHVPATEQTNNMISEAQLKLMKKGSYLINYARGKVVDVPAAAAALKSGHLRGAAFDVFPEEPHATGQAFVSELRGCPNTILTPHIGGSTEEAQALIGKEVASKLLQYINEGSTIAAVNFPEIMLPVNSSKHRILNIHKNVPGVLRDINNVLCAYNITAQVLNTKGPTGYFMCAVDSEVSLEVKEKLAKLSNSIRTRALF